MAHSAFTGVLGRAFAFIMGNKRWWLGTILFLMSLLVIVLALTEGRSIAPFIYALF